MENTETQSVPTLQFYTSLLLPHEASFFEALTQRKTDKSVDLIRAPPELVSQPSVASDQGREDTCASHAVGKATVEIVDGFSLNCDQEKIIDALIIDTKIHE